MASLQLRVLGGFAAVLPTGRSVGVSGKKNQALLTYLALHADKKLTREKLIGLLWSDRLLHACQMRAGVPLQTRLAAGRPWYSASRHIPRCAVSSFRSPLTCDAHRIGCRRSVALVAPLPPRCDTTISTAGGR